MSTNLLGGNSEGWLGAIRDAESQLKRAGKERVLDLQAVIAVFTDKMNEGEPWPGAQKKREGLKKPSPPKKLLLCYSSFLKVC